MHDLPAKIQWTGTRTITAAGNRTRASLSLLPRQYELTNKNVSYFLTNQSKTKTFIDLKVTRNPKPTKNNTRPYLNEIPTHFIHEINTVAYDVSDVNLLYQPWHHPSKNSTWPYLYEIPAHFIHEIKTKGYDVIGVNLFLRTLMRILRKKVETVVHPILLTWSTNANCSLNWSSFKIIL